MHTNLKISKKKVIVKYHKKRVIYKKFAPNFKTFFFVTPLSTSQNAELRCILSSDVLVTSYSAKCLQISVFESEMY